MTKLLIIADDFTGALDTGVQFAAKGARTCVVTDPAYNFTRTVGDIQVLVLDAETRHLTPEAAYGTVFRAVKDGLAAGFTYIYKKTDSALRGNIGAELTAVMDAAGSDRMAFLPALPKMNRTTRGGVHYIDSVPVAESIFGKDPFEPVTASSIKEIIAAQSQTPVVLHGPGRAEETTRPGIHVYDAELEEDLWETGRTLRQEELRLSAGCAGFAAVLAELLGLEGTPPVLPRLPASLFVACGSVNPVTLRQMETAERAGFPHVHLTPEQKLESSWLETPDCTAVLHSWLEDTRREKRFILDVNDPPGQDNTAAYAKVRGLTTEDLRVRISSQLGRLVQRLLDEGLEATLLCTGGDTLLALIRAVGVAELLPVRELYAGAVLTDFVYHEKTYHIISKSGGFGEPDLFVRLAQFLDAGEQEEAAQC